MKGGKKCLALMLVVCMIIPSITLCASAIVVEKKNVSWVNNYLEIINSAEAGKSFQLFYVNDDDIPELMVVGRYNAEGTKIYTAAADGSISSVNCSLNGITYSEHQNLMCDAGGSMDVFYHNIYHIEDGKFVMHYQGKYGAEDNTQVEVSPDGSPIYQYVWSGESVPKDEYYMLLYNAYPVERAKNPYEELMSGEQATAAIKDFSAAADSDLLSAENVSFFKQALGVPDGLAVRISLSDKYYWSAGERWLVNVTIKYNDKTVAGAAFDADTLEIVRDIMMYSGDDLSDREEDIAQLKREYVEQHISYYNTGFSKDIVPLESMSGMKFVMDEIDGDLSTAIYKGLSVATASYETVSDFLNISSYFEIDLGETKISLKVPDESLTSIGHSEYEAILYQLMASDAVYNGLLETFELDYEDNVRGFVKEIADEVGSLAKTEIKDNEKTMASLQKQMQEVAESVGTADKESLKFQHAAEEFELLAEQYLDLSETKKLLKDLTTTADAGLTFFNQLFDGVESIGEAYQYACWAESYAKTSETFKSVLVALREEAYQKAWEWYGTGYAGEHDPLIAYSRENMYMGLYESIDSFISTMEIYQEDAHKAFLHEIANATGGNCAKIIVDTLQDEVVDQLGGAVCPQLGAINAALGTGKLLVDLFTGIDDEYKLALAIETLDCVTALLPEVSGQYGETLVNLDRTGSYIDLTGGSLVQPKPVTVEKKFEAAVHFCKSIQTYKNAISLACDYASQYIKTKRQTSETSAALTFLAAHKLTADDIHCHAESLDQTGIFNDVPQTEYYADAVSWAVKTGITSGTSVGAFSPNKVCTRADAVTFLWRANGSPSILGSEESFVDVPDKAYYHDAALWAVDQEITFGVQVNYFCPTQPCSRAAIVTFLYRAAGSPPTQSSNSFSDIENNVYYSDAIKWATSQNIATGTSANNFSPNEPCTRAQIVTFLYRAMNQGVF